MPPLNDRLDQMRTLAKENWHFICPFQIRAEKPYYVADPEVDSLVSYMLPLHYYSYIQGVLCVFFAFGTQNYEKYSIWEIVGISIIQYFCATQSKINVVFASHKYEYIFQIPQNSSNNFTKKCCHPNLNLFGKNFKHLTYTTTCTLWCTSFLMFLHFVFNAI